MGSVIADPANVRTPIDPLALASYVVVFLLAALLTRRRPPLGIALLVLVVPLDLSRALGPTTVTLAKATLLGIAASLVARRAPAAVLRSRPALVVGGCLLAVALATALSITVAAVHGPAIRETLKAVQYLVLFAVAAIALATDPDDPAIRRACIATCAYVALAALLQLASGAPSVLLDAGHPIPRIAGPLEGPNQLSAFLAVLVTLVAAFAAGDRLARPERFAAAGALALGGAAIVLTLSRAGLLTTLLGIAVVATILRGSRPRRLARTLAWVGGGLVAGGLVLAAVVAAITHSAADVAAIFAHFGSAAGVEHAGGVGNRSILWHAAITLWRAHPLLGVGAGNFELEVGRAGAAGVRTHANSLYLQALVEGGLPLFVAVVASTIATPAVLFRAARRGRPDPFVVGTAAALTGLAVHQIFDLLVFFPKIGDLVAALGGAAVARVATKNETRHATFAPSGRYGNESPSSTRRRRTERVSTP